MLSIYSPFVRSLRRRLGELPDAWRNLQDTARERRVTSAPWTKKAYCFLQGAEVDPNKIALGACNLI